MTRPDDADDWAKEDCQCGHSRYRHNHGGTGHCTATRQRMDFSSLPTPEYAPGTDEHPFAWPTNWPAAGDVPVTDQPCDCKGFHDYEPSEPPDWRE